VDRGVSAAASASTAKRKSEESAKISHGPSVASSRNSDWVCAGVKVSVGSGAVIGSGVDVLVGDVSTSNDSSVEIPRVEGALSDIEDASVRTAGFDVGEVAPFELHDEIKRAITNISPIFFICILFRLTALS
jgi:hypothetical protein